MSAPSAPAGGAVATAPERIWLTVSDDDYDAENPFPTDHEGVCWSTDDPVAVCVPYVRADLAVPLAAVEALVAEWLSNAYELREAKQRAWDAGIGTGPEHDSANRAAASTFQRCVDQLQALTRGDK